jgi:asparaginyl-tRNA synthetase
MKKVIEWLAVNESGPIFLNGWVKTKRDSKNCSFLEVSDGSCLKGIQVVITAETQGFDLLPQATTGASAAIEGLLVESPAAGQKWEVQAAVLKIIGTCDSDYPLQKKGHTLEFLRTISHLRPRSNLFSSVFRVRSKMAYAVHQFFNERHFSYVHTPIITSSDCEGAGEMFRVSTLEQGSNLPASEDFFGKSTYLTVSGQLQGELMAAALGNIYTFGPTFRAENSNTARHAAEFWMIEPEMSFCDLQGDMDIAEAHIQSMIRTMLEQCSDELDFFNQLVDKGLRERLQKVVNQSFARMTYTDAIQVLLESKRSFEYPVVWGEALQTEHERYLAEEYFKGPVTIYNYPKSIKPFYMYQNDDGKTVAAMDLLLPGIGEIIGGSQREHRLDRLLEAMKTHDLNEASYDWYIDTRRYGSVPHAGYGMGFERMLMYLTGISNIRDVLPFPRTPKHADF